MIASICSDFYSSPSFFLSPSCPFAVLLALSFSVSLAPKTENWSHPFKFSMASSYGIIEWLLWVRHRWQVARAPSNLQYTRVWKDHFTISSTRELYECEFFFRFDKWDTRHQVAAIRRWQPVPTANQHFSPDIEFIFTHWICVNPLPIKILFNRPTLAFILHAQCLQMNAKWMRISTFLCLTPSSFF